ncbi:MAG: nucleoside recognition protein [Bacteroidales bacterium]|nr:nucleoside recognition protein [Candidatus Cacconaster merdequi]
MKEETIHRIKSCVRDVLPTTTKTCIWIIKITAGVSFAMMLLKYFNILPYISDAISPVFKYFGLPGASALAYVSGYFVNVYSAIAVMATLDLDWRALTILCTMIMASHSMVLETPVLKKTGASAVRMVIVRTLSAFILGFVLNLVLPGSAASEVVASAQPEHLSFGTALWQWLLSTLKLIVMMAAIIYALNILQRLLQEFGIMDRIAFVFKPLMRVFGLPSSTVFLWIVANVIGLGYGAAAILDSLSRNGLTLRDVKLLDSHISVSHSNLEDLILLSACGAVWWILLLSRWVMAIILVWEQKLEFLVEDIVSKNRV